MEAHPHFTRVGEREGGVIYNALIVRAAERVKSERIYTFNLDRFHRVAPEDLRQKIVAP